MFLIRDENNLPLTIFKQIINFEPDLYIITSHDSVFVSRLHAQYLDIFGDEKTTTRTIIFSVSLLFHYMSLWFQRHKSGTINSTCSLLRSRKSTHAFASAGQSNHFALKKPLPDNVRKSVQSGVRNEHVGSVNAVEVRKWCTWNLIVHYASSHTTVALRRSIRCNPATLSMCHIDVYPYPNPNFDTECTILRDISVFLRKFLTTQ